MPVWAAPGGRRSKPDRNRHAAVANLSGKRTCYPRSGSGPAKTNGTLTRGSGFRGVAIILGMTRRKKVTAFLNVAVAVESQTCHQNAQTHYAQRLGKVENPVRIESCSKQTNCFP